MTFSQIKYFVTVAKHLNFTKASELLFISQPALSRQIQSIEAELKVKLFYRTATGISLTASGALLLPGFSSLLNEYDALVAAAQREQDSISGELKIGILEDANISEFMPIVHYHFKDEYPHVDVTFSTGSFEPLLSKVYSGDLDLIFTLRFEVEKKKRILFQHITHSKDNIVMTKFHPLAEKEQLTLSDLKDEVFILISKDDNPESADLIVNLCKANGFTPNVHYAQTLAEQILLIEAGAGVSILDSHCNLKFNPYIKFFEIESNWDPSLVMAWNKYNYNPSIEIFIKKLNELMALDAEPIFGDN